MLLTKKIEIEKNGKVPSIMTRIAVPNIVGTGEGAKRERAATPNDRIIKLFNHVLWMSYFSGNRHCTMRRGGLVPALTACYVKP
jgi:hypothetical protein